MALAVEGGIFGLVDVGGDDAVEIAPADDDTHGDAALVDTLGIIGRPNDNVGDTGVDTKRAEEGAGVTDSGRCSVALMLLLARTSFGRLRGGRSRGGGWEELTRLRASQSQLCLVKRCICCRGLFGVFDQRCLRAISRCVFHQKDVRTKLTPDGDGQDRGRCVGRNR